MALKLGTSGSWLTIFLQRPSNDFGPPSFLVLGPGRKRIPLLAYDLKIKESLLSFSFKELQVAALSLTIQTLEKPPV